VDDLNDLRRVRNSADYDLDQPFSQPRLSRRSNPPRKIVRLLQELSATPAVLARVVDAIKVNECDVLRQVTWLP
jgi:hypothetical protein